MPPKKKTQSSSQSKELCCVCCQPIVQGKDESLFCGGECQQRVHRYCAGVSAQVYKGIMEKGTSFLCYSCCLQKNRKDIVDLKNVVESLKGETAELRSAMSAQPRAQQSASSVPATSSQLSTSTTPASIDGSASQRSSTANVDIRSQERKFNVVLYGVDEIPRGSLKSTRLGEDLNKATSVLSGVDQSINSSSIKDIYRLGRYSTENKKPRPLLVKFIPFTDASRVLSKRRSPQGSTVVIKPDMSPQERKCESVLLKERWQLIQSGVPREVIKIRGSRLHVRNKLYGQVIKTSVDLLFSCHNSSPDSNITNVQGSTFIVLTPSHTTSTQADSPQTALSGTPHPQEQGSVYSPQASAFSHPESLTITPTSDQ